MLFKRQVESHFKWNNARTVGPGYLHHLEGCYILYYIHFMLYTTFIKIEHMVNDTLYKMLPTRLYNP